MQSPCQLSVPLHPVYIEGVWGGFYVKHLRNLPDAMRNCAWVFDLIPMEVSIVADMDGLQLEMPYYGFVQTVGGELMGEKCHKKFDGYFPIRFNYDDTFHASGNMSIQCHPDSNYVRENNGELGRQDESYYIVVSGQGAKTYCGFQNRCDTTEFLDEIKRSEREAVPINHDKYVYAEPSKPGMQFLIPAGTIHASGRNQVILEIGSLTIGSYTYKLYDYLRKDLDGKPRPIHSYHGERVLKRERTADWVHENLIQQPRVIRETEEGREIIVGEHDLLYFTLRNLCFEKRMTDETSDRFHVLVLVEGEQVLIRSLNDPSRFFAQRYLDMVVVPASFGKYEVINQGVGSIVLHKTMLRDGYEDIER
jgi:mannose-6-phosphate isomerase class I